MCNVLKQLLISHGNKIDWMGYALHKGNRPTYHHIVKRAYGGERILENGAVLGRRSHEYLHRIEIYEVCLYSYINDVLKSINSQMHKPTINQLLDINRLLVEFEEEYQDKHSKKDKPIVEKEDVKTRALHLWR